MAHINRRFIDKHWLLFIVRGALAVALGCYSLFCGTTEVGFLIALISVFLLFMGIIDAVGALYSSKKQHGWINSVIDSLIDVVAALTLLFVAWDNLTVSLIVISVYTIISGVIDILHGFLSTVDPTDRFIRVLAGVSGCVIGAVIINSGHFELTIFIRFFGAYMLIVGATSLIYGVHNREQNIEDKIARIEARKLAKKTTKKTRKK